MDLATRGMIDVDLELAAARWVKRKIGSCEHETRVRAIAVELFQLVRDHLGLTDADGRLLRLAALTHDIGRSISEKNHPEEGAALLLGTTLLEMSPFERRAMAYFARYHRGAAPEEWEEDFLRPTDPRRTLRGLLGILRVADALDSRRIESPRLLFTARGRRLKIRCFVSRDLAEARRVYKRRKKFHLLESFLGAEIDVQVCHAENLATVG